ncbi:toll/interleukin-1 receptor domain-containing protein [Oxalicibacterium solurbis]|uniref:TIR domain-containing protein n=1 Tax=Oxalicibacterium solurbis TaxID=69280 RepID=A0A8J3F5H9_9BURK|nr:toll/interleukin-1 receptor domain-containing protein [Oxalicibacterium solurbis]GGI54079.1 hypothetical protein GCM10011430_12530 [Oxalicibacterium solurbis]
MSTEISNEVLKATNPLVFISHDTRDGDLAEAFSTLLKSVSAGVLKSFRTSDKRGNQGIEYGVEWYPEITKNIQNASDVVCLLTKRSVDRPWILFEAGMAKGKLDTPILGLALGIPLKDASSGPFAQFQNCADDEDSLIKLVFQLVNRIPNSEPDKDTIKFQVEKFRETTSKILKKLDGTPEKPIQEMENSSAKLFEEIKIMFQDLPSRIERRTSAPNKRRNHKFHPHFLEEITALSKDPRLAIKIALSFYREKMPWIYDEGILLVNRLSRRMSSTTSPLSQKAFSDFEHLMRLSTKSRIVDLLVEDEEDYFLMSELPHLIMKNLERLR